MLKAPPIPSILDPGYDQWVADVSAHYADIKFKRDGDTPLVGIMIRGNRRREDYFVGMDDPHVAAAQKLLDSARAHVTKVMGKLTYIFMGQTSGYHEYERASKQSKKTFDVRVGKINMRMTISYRNGKLEPSIDMTAVMDGSGQRAPWSVQKLVPGTFKLIPEAMEPRPF